MLTEKIVIVTGIGPGLGRTIAVEAARSGANVAMVSRTDAIMAEVADEIAALGRKSIRICADITSQNDCDRAAAETVAAFGRIDGLVNSAYFPGTLAPVLDLDLDALSRAFEVTVMGMIRMIRAVVPQMETQGGGSIVNVGSQVARKVVPNQGGYAATKAAQASLTRYLAAELGAKGIRFNTPAIGWTMSAPARAWLESEAARGGPSVAEAEAEISATMALGRVPSDAECARGILVFLSDTLSAVTGATLDINGGDYLPL
ncbi:SDR family oxidoreductase [Novosphingobium jiangmenense]|uniref:SDR family oxidoreductase n=1 Tax=Novosphingobium jiangmenense TaxID=2791981 RepID=A0ABS0HJ77_9SPHN|nr:SDR family oxidoreductase [Novosphingobium jiangmenense]